MTLPASVARRAYQAAASGATSSFFFVRRFVSTVGGPDEFVVVTCRMSGGSAGSPFSLTNVVLSFSGIEKPILFAREGETLPQIKAEIIYTGTGRLQGRWEVVQPGEELPESGDLLTEATLPIEKRGTQRRYTSPHEGTAAAGSAAFSPASFVSLILRTSRGRLRSQPPFRLSTWFQYDFACSANIQNFSNLQTVSVPLHLLFIVARNGLGQVVGFGFVSLHRCQILVFAHQHDVPIIRTMGFGSDHLVGKDLSILFERLLLPLPFAGDIIQISVLHAGFHPDETDGPNRSAAERTIDLGYDDDANH